ncbi:natural resistance-associated macrophage protein-domain-containing protein [Lipomyces oligophaga]|uniref:natural resistance-associated macrophage protein-domain-containing protein n=1 Tax=Lipomyces oligophaga TaxID=45792 RepID=UPI0034CDB9B2
MNCPTRDPEPAGDEFHNQNPPVMDNAFSTNRSDKGLLKKQDSRNIDMPGLLEDSGGSASRSIDAAVATKPRTNVETILHTTGDPVRRDRNSTNPQASSLSSSITYKKSLASPVISSSTSASKRQPRTSTRARRISITGKSFDTSETLGPAYELDELEYPLGRSAQAKPFANESIFESPDQDPFPSPNGRPTFEGPGNGLLSKYPSSDSRFGRAWDSARRLVTKYMGFIGPGFMIAVGYIDPGNYATDVAAGAIFQYRLLFVILISNMLSIYLQALCTKLGSVTGLDLAQNCRLHFSRSTCIALYLLAELAIIATDLAEVIGTAIALNILFHIPLVAGVAFTIIDVLIVLIAYKPNGSLKAVRWFEYAVAVLVIAVVGCFCVELSKVDASFGEVVAGFIPSRVALKGRGLYYSCGILGATVMPHSLYLGSGLVQPRLREYDEKIGKYTANEEEACEDDSVQDEYRYRPSLEAIKHALNISIVELAVSLITFALFVNCAILIVSGSSLSNSPGAVDADLFSIHEMLSQSLSPAAGTLFALALLFSGQSAGIVCTLAGQMVSEGFLHWTMTPWIRRLITRSLAIVPCILFAAFVGREGLGDVLNFSQVILSLILPVVSAPVVYFTCSKSIMRVPVNTSPDTAMTADDSATNIQNQMSFDLERIDIEYVDMSNGKLTTAISVLIWGFISVLNVYLIILLFSGGADPD